MISKIGSNAVSASTLVKTSTPSLQQFDCSDPNHPGTCRWDDYSAATPDPGSSATGLNGQVWLTSQWVRSTETSSTAGWGSWNWTVRP